MGESSEVVSHKRLEGKVTIITGGASGIGAATVQLFHEHGARVVVADIKDKQGKVIADKLGENVTFIHCDVSDEDDVINLIDTTVSLHGKLDIMYDNAGVMDRSLGSILDTKKSDLDLMLKVNLGGAFLGAKHAARVMIPQHKELGEYSIRVNCISPYGVVTGMTTITDASMIPMVEEILSKAGNLQGQTLRADGIAKAALYLASDDAYYVSGLNLVVDGGFSIVNPTVIQKTPNHNYD
ncbi:tropinone reductase-like 1 [Hevea brasiliensis]|uniref:tropinone reductase-like 1 n=1 Tax=Hevea brasiliensis TaxID=3981 RepID=UPI0025DBA33C|nr:tropinone reductase-like 1 [Hevea brasiliensis]